MLLSRVMAARISIVALLMLHMVATMAQNQPLQRAFSLQYTAPNTAIAIADSIANATADDTLRSKALEVKGIAKMVKGAYMEAYAAHSLAFELRKDLGWRTGMGHALNNMGLVTYKMGDLAGAMHLFLQCLKLAEAIPDSMLLTRVFGNIGNIYEEQGELDRALEYYTRALPMLQHGENNHILANTLHNIALVHSRMGTYDTAMAYWHRTLELRSRLNDDRGTAHALNNMGSQIFAKQALHATADSLFTIAFNIYQRLNDAHGMSMVSGSKGASAFQAGNTAEAIKLCELSLALAQTHGIEEYERTACLCLADAYAATGKHPQANAHLLHYIKLVENADMVASGRKAALMEQRYTHEKEQVRQQTLAQEELKRQQLLRNMSILLGILGFLLFLVQYDSYQKKQRANILLEKKNKEILHQKEQIAEKSKEITDSIKYAQRLQQARLPKQEEFQRLFPLNHLLYQPKDIVSGDFYWLEQANGHIYIAVADCTGHGVPGAMVSMIGIQGLNRAVLELGMTSPAKILQFLSQHMEEAFNKGDNTVRDGMDMALCVIPDHRKTLTFSGANNPLLHLSQSPDIENATLRKTTDQIHLYEWKADRKSIGGQFGITTFTDHTVPLSAGDRLMLFSDGYADQFGGPRNRKLGSARLRENIMLAAQNNNWQMLSDYFHEWKGEFEQIDDVTVVVFGI